jgi:hypothetical protein
MISVFQFDNTNPGLWRMASKEDPMYMALTDVPYAQHFDIDTLDTIGLLSPAPEMKIMTACTHWQREPGTDNSITFIFKVRTPKTSLLQNDMYHYLSDFW